MAAMRSLIILLVTITLSAQTPQGPQGDHGKFDELAEIKESKRDLFVDRVAFIVWGKATGTFGISLGGKIVALGRTNIICEELNKNSAGVSRLLVSNNVYNLSKVQSMFEPFA